MIVFLVTPFLFGGADDFRVTVSGDMRVTAGGNFRVLASGPDPGTLTWDDDDTTFDQTDITFDMTVPPE